MRRWWFLLPCLLVVVFSHFSVRPAVAWNTSCVDQWGRSRNFSGPDADVGCGCFCQIPPSNTCFNPGIHPVCDSDGLGAWGECNNCVDGGGGTAGSTSNSCTIYPNKAWYYSGDTVYFGVDGSGTITSTTLTNKCIGNGVGGGKNLVGCLANMSLPQNLPSNTTACHTTAQGGTNGTCDIEVKTLSATCTVKIPIACSKTATNTQVAVSSDPAVQAIINGYADGTPCPTLARTSSITYGTYEAVTPLIVQPNTVICARGKNDNVTDINGAISYITYGLFNVDTDARFALSPNNAWKNGSTTTPKAAAVLKAMANPAGNVQPYVLRKVGGGNVTVLADGVEKGTVSTSLINYTGNTTCPWISSNGLMTNNNDCPINAWVPATATLKISNASGFSIRSTKAVNGGIFKVTVDGQDINKTNFPALISTESAALVDRFPLYRKNILDWTDLTTYLRTPATAAVGASVNAIVSGASNFSVYAYRSPTYSGIMDVYVDGWNGSSWDISKKKGSINLYQSSPDDTATPAVLVGGPYDISDGLSHIISVVYTNTKTAGTRTQVTFDHFLVNMRDTSIRGKWYDHNQLVYRVDADNNRVLETLPDGKTRYITDDAFTWGPFPLSPGEHTIGIRTNRLQNTNSDEKATGRGIDFSGFSVYYADSIGGAAWFSNSNPDLEWRVGTFGTAGQSVALEAVGDGNLSISKFVSNGATYAYDNAVISYQTPGWSYKIGSAGNYKIRSEYSGGDAYCPSYDTSPSIVSVATCTKPILSYPANGATFSTGAYITFSTTSPASPITYNIRINGVDYPMNLNTYTTQFNTPGTYTWYVTSSDSCTSETRSFTISDSAFVTYGGDVTAQGAISDTKLKTGNYISNNPTAGIVLGNGIDIGLEGGGISQAGWSLPSYTSAVPTDKVSYDQILATTLKNAGVGKDSLDIWCSDTESPHISTVNSGLIGPYPDAKTGFNVYCYRATSGLSGLANLAPSTGVTIFYPAYNGSYDVTIGKTNTQMSVSGGKKIVFFVDNRNHSAAFSAGENVTVDTASGIVFVVKGSINVLDTVSQLDGLYIFSGTFSDQNTSTTTLVGHGALIGTGASAFTRTALASGFARPGSGGFGEKWYYEPKYLDMFKNIISRPTYTWKELPPD